MRLEGYEIVEELLDDAFAAPEQTPRWLARDADGSFVELATIHAAEADRQRTLHRFAQLQAFAHPALPRLVALEGDPAVITQLVVVSQHRTRVTLARVARAQIDEDGKPSNGLAVALVCTVACAAARALAAMHDEDVVHGRVDTWSVAVGPNGDILLDTPRIRTAIAPPTPRDDVAALKLMMCALISGADHLAAEAAHAAEALEDGYEPDFETPDAFELAPAIELAPAARLAAARADVPRELLAILSDETLDARDFADALQRELPWAQWSAQQVLDEMRALLPVETERMAR